MLRRTLAELLAAAAMTLAAPAAHAVTVPDWGVILGPHQSATVPFAGISDVHCYSFNYTPYDQVALAPDWWGWYWSMSLRAVYQKSTRTFVNATDTVTVRCAAWRG